MRTEHINERESSFQGVGLRKPKTENPCHFYADLMTMTERINRLFGEVIERELADLSIFDINSTQAMVLFHIGKDEISVTEIIQRGYYLGSNVSYNLRHMVENGYILQISNPRDRRSSRVSLSFKGFDLLEKLETILEKQALVFQKEIMNDRDSDGFFKTMKKTENLLSFFLQSQRQWHFLTP